MAKIPLDVKALIEEALNVSAAAKEPVSVSVYLDETAPQDIVAHVRNLFASAAVHVRVTLSYLGPSQAPVGPADDLAVIVAGKGQGVGAFAQQAREKGVPAMVVTTCPAAVERIAAQAGFPIPAGDVVSPVAADAASAPLVAALTERFAARKDPKPQDVAAGQGGTVGASPACAGAEPGAAEAGVAAAAACGAAGAAGAAAGAAALAVAEQEQAPAEPIALTAEAVRVLNDRMGAWVIEACRDKRLSMALAFPFVRRPLALDAVNTTAVQNAGIGVVVFVPGADMPLMTMNQAKMLLQIAAAWGQPMNAERVKELAAVVAGGFAFRTVAREVSGVVPVVGWAVKGVIAYAGTQAMGHAAIDYFESGGGVAGLAGVVAHARDAAVSAALQDQPEQPEEPQEKSVQEAVAQAAQEWGKRAGKAANIAGKAAGPFMRTVAQAGLDSFVAGAASMAQSVKKH